VIDRGSWIILGLASALRLALNPGGPPGGGPAGSPLGQPMIAAVFGLAAGAALVATSTIIGDAAAGRRAAWLWAVMPLFTGLFLLAGPMGPLYACVAWAIFFLTRALMSGQARWWVVAGLLTGLGALADWSALLLPMGLGLAMAGSQAMRRLLAGRAQGLATAVALVLAALALLWRSKVGGRWMDAGWPAPEWFAGDSAVERGVAFVLSEALVAGPLLALLLATVAVLVLRNGAAPSRAVLTRWLLVVLITCGALAFLGDAVVSRAPIAWLAGVPVLATSALVVERKNWWRAGLAVALAITLALPGRLRPTPWAGPTFTVPPQMPAQ